MPNLNSTIDLDVKKFFRWWMRELGFFVPEKIRRLVNEKQGFIIVRPEGYQFALSYVHEGQAEPLAALERHIDNRIGGDRQAGSGGMSKFNRRASDKEDYAHKAQDGTVAIFENNPPGILQYKTLRANDERLAKANLILRLTANEAIQKELALPAAVKENLLQVVAYELDRYTPFKPEQVYFAVKLLESDNEPGFIRAMLVLTPRETLDALYEDMKAMGMSPLFVDYDGSPNELDQLYDSYNLLPERLREKTPNAPRMIYTALISAVFLLLGTALALPVWFEYQTAVSLQEKIDAIEKDAKGVKALQLETDAIINETQLLIAEKNAAPSIVEMLNALSALIKDDTWLSYIQYSDGHLQIQGESPAASALIGVLEESELFANARFVSPVTQDKASALERFQITVDVTPPMAPPPPQSDAAPISARLAQGGE